MGVGREAGRGGSLRTVRSGTGCAGALGAGLPYLRDGTQTRAEPGGDAGGGAAGALGAVVGGAGGGLNAAPAGATWVAGVRRVPALAA